MAIKVNYSGTVIVVDDNDGTNKSGKEWRSRDIVVETGTEQYPNPLKATFWNNKVADVARVGVGDLVQIEAYVNGREWNDKYSVKLSGQSCTVTQKAANPPPETADEPAPDESVQYDSVADDMPF